MDAAALFNDAGVRLLLSKDAKLHYNVALDLFRGALETKLTLEFAQSQMTMREASIGEVPLVQPSSQPLLNPTPASYEAIHRAAMHLNQLESYLTPLENPTLSYFSAGGTASFPQSSLESTHGAIFPLQNLGYEPFICTFPLFFGENVEIEMTMTVVSSVIVYHLGLVHQLIGRHCSKTADFYTIAASLLATGSHAHDTLLLRISLLNNFGVWCFENGDGESMRVCMEHLTSALDGEEREEQCMIEPDILQKVRRNILWLLTPPDGGSPAA